MPPQSKKQRRVIPAAIISDLDQPQDYVDPLKKLAFNPGQTTAEKVVAAAGKRPVVRPKARVSKVARRLADQPTMQFDESARMTPAELADYQLPNEREAEARRFEELTTVPDITLSATGAIQPGSGLVLSSIMRYGYQGLNNSLALTGQVLQDVFGSDDMPTVLGGLGQALSNIAKESAPTFENYDLARPVKERGVLDRTVGFLTQLGIQLPQMAVATELLGPAAGFGVYKAESLHAAGEQDPATLAGAFVQGAAEGTLLSALGKTASVIRKTPRTGPVVDLLKKSPVAAQAGAQLVGGMAQTGVDGMLHPGQPAPDWLDYLHGGVANVIMDPVVLGGSGRSRKATQAATRMSGELDPSSYNLDLPPDNLAALRQDFWQPQDLPWDNRVTVGLLNKARVQLVDNPADSEGVLYLNPQAAAVIDRASQAVLPGSKIMSGVAQGMSLPARDAGLVAEHLLEKAAQFKETIKQLPDGDPKLNDLATGAVVFESLAEHLQAATAGGERSAALRVLNKQKAADPANPVARAFDQTVTGHESIHVQTDKIAKEMGVDPRATVSPGWLADHPIGAKVILGIGDSKSPLQGYDPVEWTNEAIAYAAQPGPDPGLGLTKQERGVLVGDYFAAVMDKHGPGVMEQVWVGRMDREVAQVAFKRLYESNRVRYTRDPISGKRLGLEWRGVEPPKFSERIPNNGYGVETQPFPTRFAMVGSPTRVNKAILLNDLDQRMQTSKVRNARGELIPVYHGSPKGVAIDRLDLDKLNPGDWLKGFFTTQDVRTAGAYSKQSGMGDNGRDGGSNIHKFYLDAKKPLDLDGLVNLDFITEFIQRLGVEPDSSGGSYPEGLMMDVLDYARASLRRSGNIDTQSMAKVRAIKNAIESDDLELHVQAGELRDEYTKRAQDLRDKYKAAANQNPDGRLRIHQQHAERSEETQLEYWFRQEDRKIQQRKDAHRDQLRKLEIEEGELQRAGRMPNNEVIERIRRVLLDMGYDAATHIGGGERDAKEFKTKEEAEAYAAETGGSVEEWTGHISSDDMMQGKGTPIYAVRGHRVWIAFHPDQLVSATAYEPITEGFVSAGTRLWNQQPDPDYDAANPAGEAADEVSGKLELDPDITHLRKTNAPPEISQQVAVQREAERKAYREVANLRARIRRNNDLAAAATKMQEDAGLPQPELDAEIQQLGAELKQQHVEAVKKFRELRNQGNVLKGQLAGQLGDNTARKRAEAKLAAKGRLANGDQLPPLDSPLEQVRMSNEYGNFLANLAKDMLIASDVPLLDSSEMSTMDQLINAMRTGRTTVPQLDEVAKRYGLKDTVELFERFRQFGSAAGRDLNIFARQQREINKLRGLSPELDDWINSRPPTMQEIDAIANGPSIARQLVNLNIGATIAQLATQTPNVVTGLANATGVRSIINLADQVIERAIGSKRELTGGPGEPSKFEQNSVPPLSTVLAPVFAASTVVKDIIKNPYWFAHGIMEHPWDPGTRPEQKSVRIAQELHNFHPELMRKFDSQLNDDVIQIHLLPHAEAVQAERDALTLLKNQVTNMPAGADKFARLARIKEAEARLAKFDRWLPKVLHEASRGLHKYLTLARMGERFVRTISLVSNLETEAARYGLDLEQLDTANEIHKLPAAVVERAVNQALQDTYATRPEPGSLTAQAYNWYAKSNDPAAVLTSAVFPFVGFMGNYAKMVLDYSPLPIIKAALVGAGESGPTVENHQKLIKATLGTAVYAAVAALIEDKYDEAERTGKPVGSWHSVGGVSVRNVPQLVAPLYVADYIARQRRGLAAPDADSALEFFNILAGLDMRNITGTFKWLDDLVTAAQDQTGNKGTKAAEAAATAFSDWFGRYLTPLNMYTDIGAQYWKGMRDVKDLYGMGAGSLFAPILNRIPVAREQLSDKIDPYTGMPVHRTDLPAIKAITGFTVLPEQSYPARIFQHAGIKLTDWIPFTGVTEVDRDLVATIGRMMKERTADLEATQQHMDIDQKIVDTYDVARGVADDAFEEVLSRYPEVERKLEDAGEFNRWERRVEDKERKRAGKPTLAEEQLQLMQQRKAAAGSVNK